MASLIARRHIDFGMSCVQILSLCVIFALSLAVSDPAEARVSCKSFKTYAEALAFYTERKKAGKSGWKSLDRDRDGRPCECLPGHRGRDPKACRRKTK